MMKPSGYVSEQKLKNAKVHGHAELFVTAKATKNTPYPVYGKNDLERAVYDAEKELNSKHERAIAEAVAAEMERCAKVCKDVRLNEISAPADWHNDACEACIRAIRSAAK